MLNDRFAKGKASNVWEGAGVLVRQFDRLDAGDDGKPWMPCPQTGYNNWCKGFGGLWASTLIGSGHKTTRLYMDSTCGLVLAPTVELFCAYSEDGNSMDARKVCQNVHGDTDAATGKATCIPGCDLPGYQCADKLAADVHAAGPYVSGCSYPPTQLREALVAHQYVAEEQQRDMWNEMVIDLRTVVAGLPDVVEGFFCPAAADYDARAKLKHVRHAFIGEYNQDAAKVLLLELDTSNLDAPFSIMSA